MRSFLCCAPIGATKTCIPLFVTSDAVSKNFHYSIAATSTGSSSLVPADVSAALTIDQAAIGTKC